MPKNILITGAARRIGAACARLLHAQDYNLIVHYHTSQREADVLCAELNQIRTDSAVSVQADLSNPADWQGLVDFAVNQWGGIDVLVNNAAKFYPNRFGSVSVSEWDDLFNSNLRAGFFLAQALQSSLVSRQGCIVNITDIYAEKGLLGYPVYSMAKAGLEAMTRCLAKELAPDVRVNAVAPGAILWPESEDDAEKKQLILQRIALQHLGDVADIAKAVLFLIKDAPYVTGQTLSVDGGRSLFF